jgi:hypothetical protein
MRARRSLVAKHLVEKHVSNLKRRNEPEEKIRHEKGKTEKEIVVACWITGLFFFGVSATILALEQFHVFP